MFFKSHYKIMCVLALVIVATGVLLYSRISFDYRNAREGIYILRGENGDWFELTDDLSPEDMSRLLWSRSWSSLKKAKSMGACVPSENRVCSSFEWNEENGRGFIKTIYPDGTKLVIALGRFIGSTTHMPVSGLFIGGGLPTGDPDYLSGNSNEAGMTYFDGSKWFHIWCNVNEGIIDADGNNILPATWTLISSKILESSEHELTIISKHRTMVSNVPVFIERTMFYQTGDTFVTLTTRVTNGGKAPTFFRYVYGDEPWLGDYSSYSKGDIGWFKDGLIATERLIDTARYSYLGMFDYGNNLAGEFQNFTGKANFIEWDPASRPDVAYISNQFTKVAPAEQKVPLSSDKTRVVSMEWGPHNFKPGESLSFALKVGMADIDTKTGLPVKPETLLY